MINNVNLLLFQVMIPRQQLPSSCGKLVNPFFRLEIIRALRHNHPS